MENTDYFHNSLSATQLRLIPSTIRHLYNIAETRKQKQLYYYYRELLRPLFYVYLTLNYYTNHQIDYAVKYV